MSSSSLVREAVFLVAKKGQVWTFMMSFGLRNGLELI